MLQYLLVPLLLLPLVSTHLSAASYQELQRQHDQMRQETMRLLNAVDNNVREQTRKQEEEARREAEGADPLAGSAGRAQIPYRVEAERRKLLDRVIFWSRGSIGFINELTREEISETLTRATAIAKVYGLDVEKLNRLYELGKKLIREGEFNLPESPPPDKDDRLSRYFSDLFTWSHNRELEISEYRSRNQEYRVGLFKRTTLAYMRALLSAGEPSPRCALKAPSKTTHINGREVKLIGCPDPVVDQFRRYVKAIHKIQSADADLFLAQSEEIVGEQQLAADLISVLPVAGEFIDLYSLYYGEDLAGNCLSRFEKGLTAIFLAVPIVGPTIVKQVVKRSPAAAQGLQKLTLFLDATGEWMGDLTEGLATRWAVSAPELTELWRSIRNIDLQIDISPGLSEAARRRYLADMDNTEFLNDFMQRASRGMASLNNAPEQILRRARARAKNAVDAMLNRVQGSRAARIEAGGLVPAHVDAFEHLSRARGEIYIFRGVNPDTRRLLLQDFSTKGMNIKGKSADWGPHSAFIPVEQKFSKLGNPRFENAAEIDSMVFGEIADFHKKLDKCLQKKACLKTEAVMPDGTRIMIAEDPGVGREMPVTLKDGEYFDLNGKPFALAPGNRPRAMEVVAVLDENGNLVPVTADYDLLAFGFQGEGSTEMGFHETLGNIGSREAEALDQLNAAGNLAGYKGGKLSHHGAENVNPGTPGALGLGPNDDKVVTALDPELGTVTIPVCDAQCMQQWCDRTRSCGGLKVCGETPTPPCIPIDPDRVAKDYFHERRLAGYNLTPNSRWHWGDYNPLGGWTVQGNLREGVTGQLTIGSRRHFKPVDYQKASQAILRGVKVGGKYLFACAKDNPGSR